MDHERVAALHDGKLGAPERDDLLAAIAADDDESWLFAETAAVVADVEAARAGARPSEADPVHPANGIDPPATFTADPPPSPAAMDDEREDDGVIPLATRRPAESPAAGADAETAPRDDEGVIPIGSRRRPASRRWMVYGAMAAALAGIAVTAALLDRSGNERFDDPVGAVALLHGGATPGIAKGWEEPWRSDARGTGPSVPLQRVSVEMGAYLVDLELAAAANDTATLYGLSRKVAARLDEQHVDGSARAAGFYRAVSLGEGGPPGPKLVAARQDLMRLMDRDGMELGIWAETARTAAVRQDAGFFRLRATNRVLKRAESLPDPHGEIRNAVARVRAALPASGRATRWAVLEERLSDLLSEAGR